jgi:cytochrome c oxidase cbb3-type subunit III
MFRGYSALDFLMAVVIFAIWPIEGGGQTRAEPAGPRSDPAGQRIFSSTCAGCHGLDGRGGEHAPNIATDTNIQRLTDPELARIVRAGIPTAGMPGFGSSLKDGQITTVINYLRVLQGQGGGAGIPVTGDPSRGRVLFFGSARCSECHIVEGHGGFLGPDLSGYGKSHSATGIRRSIVEPDKNLDTRRATTVDVFTRAGKKYTGVIRNEDNFSLQMQANDGSFFLFDKSELVRIAERPITRSQHGSKLRGSELDDLISFLMTNQGVQATEADEEE